MITIKFYIGRPNTKGTAAISCYIRWKLDTAKIGTGLLVNPQDWDTDKMEAKGPGRSFINGELNRYRSAFAKALEQLANRNEEPTPAKVAQQMKALVGKKGRKAEQPSVDIYELFLKSGDVVNNTRKNRKNTLKFLKELGGLEATQKLDFGQKLTERMKKLMPGTQKVRVSTIWTFLRFAKEHQAISLIPPRPKLKKVISARPVFLTEQEISQLKNATMPTPQTENARAILLAGICTGQRFSDLLRFRPEDVQGNFWHLRQQKTGAIVKIPLVTKTFGNASPYLEAIEKTEFFHVRHVKWACQAAGINAMVQVLNKKSELVTVEKWKATGTHTGRRTFITTCLLKGVPLPAIQAVTGHTTLRIMEKYIGLLADEDLSNAF